MGAFLHSSKPDDGNLHKRHKFLTGGGFGRTISDWRGTGWYRLQMCMISCMDSMSVFTAMLGRLWVGSICREMNLPSARRAGNRGLTWTDIHADDHARVDPCGVGRRVKFVPGGQERRPGSRRDCSDLTVRPEDAIKDYPTGSTWVVHRSKPRRHR